MVKVKVLSAFLACAWLAHLSEIPILSLPYAPMHFTFIWFHFKGIYLHIILNITKPDSVAGMLVLFKISYSWTCVLFYLWVSDTRFLCEMWFWQEKQWREFLSYFENFENHTSEVEKSTHLRTISIFNIYSLEIPIEWRC